jgi:hypothetical protein
VRLYQATQTLCGRGNKGTLASKCVIGVIGLAQGCDHIAPETATDVLVLLAEPLLKFTGRHGQGVRNQETVKRIAERNAIIASTEELRK